MSRTSISVAAFGVVDLLAIIFGAVFSGSECKSPLISFDLAKWLLYGGIASGAASFAIFLLFVNRQGDFVKFAIAKIFFMVAWFIVGVIIISTVSSTCKQSNYTIYVMTIIYLIFLGLSAFGTKVAAFKEYRISTQPDAV